jgi:hypothetical protein
MRLLVSGELSFDLITAEVGMFARAPQQINFEEDDIARLTPLSVRVLTSPGRYVSMSAISAALAVKNSFTI